MHGLPLVSKPLLFRHRTQPQSIIGSKKKLSIVATGLSIRQNTLKPRVCSSSAFLCSLSSLYRTDRLSGIVARSASNDDSSGSEDSLESGSPKSFSGTMKHIKTSTQIFMAVLVYIIYFFGASAWDRKGKNR